jgi:hypothetical protein
MAICVENCWYRVSIQNNLYHILMVASKVGELLNPSPVDHLNFTVRSDQWLKSIKIKKENMYTCPHAILSNLNFISQHFNLTETPSPTQTPANIHTSGKQSTYRSEALMGF